MQLFIDPSTPGRNEVHLTFVDANGLGVAEITAPTASLTAGTERVSHSPLDRLLSVGHFVADPDLTVGAHRLAVTVPRRRAALSTTFSFKLRAGGAAQGR